MYIYKQLIQHPMDHAYLTYVTPRGHNFIILKLGTRPVAVAVAGSSCIGEAMYHGLNPHNRRLRE